MRTSVVAGEPGPHEGVVVIGRLPHRQVRTAGHHRLLHFVSAGADALDEWDLQRRGRLVVFAGDAQGRDGYLRELEELARTAGIADRIKFAGHVADIAAAYAAAHVTVVASIEPEAFGRAAAEALAVGCPVITTDLGAPPEIVLAEPVVPANEITGWVVAPNAEDLARALKIALSLPADIRCAMGQRAIADMRARFTLDSMKQQTLRVYDRLLGTTLSALSATD